MRRLIELTLAVLISVGLSSAIFYFVMKPLMQPKIAVINVNDLVSLHTHEFAAYGLGEEKMKKVAEVFGETVNQEVMNLQNEGYIVLEKAAVISDDVLDLTKPLFDSTTDRIFNQVELGVTRVKGME